MDEYGNCVLEDADGVVIAEGYGVDGYGGFTPDYGNITNTSRSTDFTGPPVDEQGYGGDGYGGEGYAADGYGGDGYGGDGYGGDGYGGDGGAAAAQMLWVTCQSKCLFTAPDGVVGLLVALPPSAESPPYVFVQVHEQQQVKKSALSRARKEVRCMYMSLDIAAYGIGGDYVESHV